MVFGSFQPRGLALRICSYFHFRQSSYGKVFIGRHPCGVHRLLIYALFSTYDTNYGFDTLTFGKHCAADFNTGGRCDRHQSVSRQVFQRWWINGGVRYLRFFARCRDGLIWADSQIETFEVRLCVVEDCSTRTSLYPDRQRKPATGWPTAIQLDGTTASMWIRGGSDALGRPLPSSPSITAAKTHAIIAPPIIQRPSATYQRCLGFPPGKLESAFKKTPPINSAMMATGFSTPKSPTQSEFEFSWVPCFWGS